MKAKKFRFEDRYEYSTKERKKTKATEVIAIQVIILFTVSLFWMITNIIVGVNELSFTFPLIASIILMFFTVLTCIQISDINYD